MQSREQILSSIAASEAVARAAAESVPQIRSEGEVLGVWIGREWHESRPFVNHVIAWDPARVLAVCAGAKTLVAEVESWTHYVCEDGWYTCGAATEEREGEECIDHERGPGCDCGRDSRAARTLAAVAAMFAEPGEES